MNSDYIIKDNFLEISEFEKIKEITYSNNLNWTYHHDTVGAKSDDMSSFSTNLEDIFEYSECEQFVASIINNSEVSIQNKFNATYFEKLVIAISLMLNKEIFIERIKINSNFYSNIKNSNKILFSTPHIDINNSFRENFTSLSAIFYLQNRNDGTILFNEKQSDIQEEKSFEGIQIRPSPNIFDILPSFLTKKEYITSVENRLVVFPTNLFHSGCYSQSDTSRFIINLNFWVKND